MEITDIPEWIESITTKEEITARGKVAIFALWQADGDASQVPACVKESK